MKKNTLFVLFCLISLFFQAQNSGLADKSHLRDTAINQADTVAAKTFIEFENSNAGYGYSVFKAFAPGNPKLNFGYYALFGIPQIIQTIYIIILPAFITQATGITLRKPLPISKAIILFLIL